MGLLWSEKGGKGGNGGGVGLGWRSKLKNVPGVKEIIPIWKFAEVEDRDAPELVDDSVADHDDL